MQTFWDVNHVGTQVNLAHRPHWHAGMGDTNFSKLSQSRHQGLPWCWWEGGTGLGRWREHHTPM